MDIALFAVAAGIVGIIVGYALRGGGAKVPAEPPTDPHLPFAELGSELRAGRTGNPAADDPDALREIRQAVSQSWVPANAHKEEALSQALGRIAAFLEESVQKPLQKVRDGDEALLREGVDRALGGIKDLEFFLREPITPDETHNLIALSQQATKDFIRDWEIAVRFTAPQFPVRAHVHRETFMDALYLLLHNAGQFGKGSTIELRIEESEGHAHVVIRDEGPGFSDEALDRARDLFFTTKPSGLGLGIPFARKIIEGFGGNLELSNRESGGAEVRLTLPVA